LKLEALILLVPALPLLGFVVLGLLPLRSRAVVAVVASGSVLLAFVAAAVVAVSGARGHVGDYAWIGSGSAVTPFSFGLLADNLSLTMLLVITGVGFLIHVYSAGYMADDDAYRRFFAYLNLFIAAMALLVSADGYLLLLVGWSGVGLASFLLIGHYFTRPSAVAAARKALVVNVIGDAAIMLAIFIMLAQFGTVRFGELFPQVGGSTALLGAAALLLVAAAAKSAQLPLYVWLPDAMEGPTPVSALIHAATMVTAGVYLLVRSYPLYNPLLLSGGLLLDVIAWLGAITALFAATVALVQSDLKRVLAYSTISQLGYMFMAIGVGANGAAMFHLVTHAFFKACLFLAAGLAIHELGGEQDMRRMGGLRRRLPFAWACFLLGTLAISGIPPLAGFFSKDEILTAARAHSTSFPALWLVGLVTAALTAFYMFRAYMLTFEGPPTVENVPDPAPLGHGEEGQPALPHSPLSMRLPVAGLATLSLVGGFIGLPGASWFTEWLKPVFEQYGYAGQPERGFDLVTALLAVGAAVAGIGLAYLLYSPRPGEQRKFGTGGLAARLAGQEWYVQEGLRTIVVAPLQAAARFCYNVFEKVVMERLIGAFRSIFAAAGWLLSRGETGLLRNYALVVLAGAVAIVVYALLPK